MFSMGGGGNTGISLSVRQCKLCVKHTRPTVLPKIVFKLCTYIDNKLRFEGLQDAMLTLSG